MAKHKAQTSDKERGPKPPHQAEGDRGSLREQVAKIIWEHHFLPVFPPWEEALHEPSPYWVENRWHSFELPAEYTEQSVKRAFATADEILEKCRDSVWDEYPKC